MLKLFPELESSFLGFLVARNVRAYKVKANLIVSVTSLGMLQVNLQIQSIIISCILKILIHTVKDTKIRLD